MKVLWQRKLSQSVRNHTTKRLLALHDKGGHLDFAYEFVIRSSRNQVVPDRRFESTTKGSSARAVVTNASATNARAARMRGVGRSPTQLINY